MKCRKCGTNKLSQEYPWEALTPTCQHPPLDCLRCVIQHVKEKHECSQCNVAVTEQSPGFLNCEELLRELYPRYPPSETIFHGQSTVAVVTPAGERATIDYSPGYKVYELQNEVHSQLGIPPNKQRFLLRDQQLHVLREDKSDNATFQDYGVEPGDEISVLVVLCDIPLDIRDVCFELSWGYPEHEKDVLDGSVFMYAGIEFKGIVHHKQCKSQCCGAVQHSGEQHLDDDTRRGFQEIPINLTTMDPSVDRLFLTLSALNSPSICSFKQLSLKVYDKRYPKIMLCTEATVTENDLKKTIGFLDIIRAKFSSTRAIMTKKSLIMYCLRKTCDSWEVLSIKKLSSGNLEECQPIQKAIEKLIKNDLKICAKTSSM